MRHDVFVRPATSADWPTIVALLESHALPLDGARGHLSDYLVAIADNTVIGVIGLEACGNVGLLRSAAVATSVHGRGVGNALTQQLMVNARTRGICTLHLLTLTASDYFAGFGFERASRAEASVELQASAEFRGACPAQAIFMKLSLPDPDGAPHG